MRKPVRVKVSETSILRQILTSRRLYKTISTFEVFVTNTKRGRCSYKNHNITVPLWAFLDKRPGYCMYYTCHELAHTVTSTDAQVHGPEFMENFKRICPEHLQHFELGYKPRLAAAAGISR